MEKYYQDFCLQTNKMKRLLEILLQSFEKHSALADETEQLGICICIELARLKDIISNDEAVELHKYMSNNNPFPNELRPDGFFWDPYNREVRFDWLNEQILKF